MPFPRFLRRRKITEQEAEDLWKQFKWEYWTAHVRRNRLAYTMWPTCPKQPFESHFSERDYTEQGFNMRHYLLCTKVDLGMAEDFLHKLEPAWPKEKEALHQLGCAIEESRILIEVADSAIEEFFSPPWNSNLNQLPLRVNHEQFCSHEEKERGHLIMALKDRRIGGLGRMSDLEILLGSLKKELTKENPDLLMLEHEMSFVFELPPLPLAAPEPAPEPTPEPAQETTSEPAPETTPEIAPETHWSLLKAQVHLTLWTLAQLYKTDWAVPGEMHVIGYSGQKADQGGLMLFGLERIERANNHLRGLESAWPGRRRALRHFRLALDECTVLLNLTSAILGSLDKGIRKPSSLLDDHYRKHYETLVDCVYRGMKEIGELRELPRVLNTDVEAYIASEDLQ